MTNEFTNWHNYYYQVSMLFAEIEEHFYQLIATPVIIVLACKDHLFLHQGTDLKTFCALTVRMAFGYFYHSRFAECFFYACRRELSQFYFQADPWSFHP